MNHEEWASERALSNEHILVPVLEFLVKEPDVDECGDIHMLEPMLGSLPDTRSLYPCCLVNRLRFMAATKLMWRFNPPIRAFQTVESLTQAGIYRSCSTLILLYGDS